MNKITLTVLALTISAFSFSQGVVNTTYLREPYVGTYKSKINTLYLSKYNFVLSWGNDSVQVKGDWRLNGNEITLMPEKKHGMYIRYKYKKLSQKLCPSSKHERWQCYRRQY